MFAAVLPPEHVVDDLAGFLGPRQEAERQLRWTMPEQWHITLAFLPDVPDRAWDDLQQRLTRAAARRTPMRVSVAGGGAFPHAGRGKVLYAGVDCLGAHEELRRLAVGARAAANKAGAPASGGRFHAHLTLARSGRPVPMTNLIGVLEAYRGPDWTIEQVALVASHLGEGPRKRPRYEVVDTFGLGRRAAADPDGETRNLRDIRP